MMHSSEACSEITIVTAADEAYALPLAVTIRSALDCLAPQRRIRLFVLDGGISVESKHRLSESWSDSRLKVEWLHVPAAELHDLHISMHVNHVTYFRILMPRLLPTEVTRALYLDADLLVRRDLGQLWDSDLGNCAALAAVDPAVPVIDVTLPLPKLHFCRQFLIAKRPIPNYHELGLAGDAPYLNGGVLLVDLDAWRRERLMERMLACLREHHQHVRWWDQYALNVVLFGRWQALDPRWNQGGHIYAFPGWRKSPYSRETFTLLRDDPWIVHFTSSQKPWHYYNNHPFRGEYLAALDRTAWNRWRPAPPTHQPWRNWWRYQWAPMRRWLRSCKTHVMDLSEYWQQSNSGGTGRITFTAETETTV